MVASRDVRDSQCTMLPSGTAGALRVAAGFCSFLDSTDDSCSQPSNQYAGVRCSKYLIYPKLPAMSVLYFQLHLALINLCESLTECQ